MVDLRTTVRPGQSGYPLNAARDALQDRARWAFSDLVEEVERENESVGRSQEDEVFEPDADDLTLRRGAAGLTGVGRSRRAIVPQDGLSPPHRVRSAGGPSDPSRGAGQPPRPLPSSRG